MAKPEDVDGVTLTYPAVTAYKQWVRKELQRRGWTQQKLVDEMKEKAKKILLAIPAPKGQTMYDTISTATVSGLLGPEGVTPKPSNCSWMPALNKVLGIAPPPVCDPNDDIAQITDRFRATWATAPDEIKRAILALLGE